MKMKELLNAMQKLVNDERTPVDWNSDISFLIGKNHEDINGLERVFVMSLNVATKDDGQQDAVLMLKSRDDLTRMEMLGILAADGKLEKAMEHLAEARNESVRTE